MNLPKAIAIAALCFLMPGCASFPSGHAYVGKLGCVGSCPVETVFYRNADGEILGLYVFYEGVQRKQTSGILDMCKLKPDRILECQWRDLYGSGNFAAEFSGGYSEFRGAWGGLYEDVLARGTYWNGKRLDASVELPGETQR